MKDQIEKSRALQIQKKRDERDREQADQRQFSEYWKMRSDELQVAEHIEKQENKQRSEDIKEYLRKQMEARQKRAEEDFKQDLSDAARTQALLDQQEKGFYSYAEQALKEWQAKGKNVTPMILELKNYKKKVF